MGLKQFVLQNIFICVPQKKVSYAGLEWYEGE